MCSQACSAGQDRGGGQDGQQPGLRPSLPPHPAEDHARHGQDDQQARPVPGAGQYGQGRVRVRHRGQDGRLEPGQVAAPADQQPRAQARDHRGQQDGDAPERDPAARGRRRGQDRDHRDHDVEQDRGVRGGVGQGQGRARRDHPAWHLTPLPGPQHAPGRQRDEGQGQGVVGGERAEVQRRAEHGEQRGGEERGPPPVPRPRRAPQQRGRREHEGQGQDPGPGQAGHVVRDRAQRRVDHRRAGEVVGERRDGRAVQPARPLQVAGPQIQGLVLVGRVRPDQPERQQRLDDEYRQQRPPAGHVPPGGLDPPAGSGPPGHQRARRGLGRRRRMSIHDESPRLVPGVPEQPPTLLPGTLRRG